MSPGAVEILSSVLFAAAVLHTLCVKRFAHWAHQSRPGSGQEKLLHFLAETEVVFGLWAAALFLSIAALKGSFHDAVEYVDGLDFTEPKFIFAIVVVAATRPVVKLAEALISVAARLMPMPENLAFYIAALFLGPLLGSFITEPAAMTVLAVVLKRRYFDRHISGRLTYATLGLLFVNVSIGGTLTHFAAPPVLMVAAKWDWGFTFMIEHFGWRAAAACAVSTGTVTAIFWRELKGLKVEPEPKGQTPVWLTGLHLLFLGLIVAFSHHPDVFFGILVLFLGLVTMTRQYQDPPKLREGLLVGFFLAGLVTLGSLQSYWLNPLIQALDGNALFFGATGLTAITDNAALTYLGSLVAGISEEQKYALVAGAVTGGGLTVMLRTPLVWASCKTRRSFRGKASVPSGFSSALCCRRQ